MANAARTMGLSGVQNLGNVLIGSQKMDQANRNILPNQQNQQVYIKNIWTHSPWQYQFQVYFSALPNLLSKF